jgi:hypothetical protein
MVQIQFGVTQLMQLTDGNFVIQLKSLVHGLQLLNIMDQEVTFQLVHFTVLQLKKLHMLDLNQCCSTKIITLHHNILLIESQQLKVVNLPPPVFQPVILLVIIMLTVLLSVSANLIEATKMIISQNAIYLVP